MLERLQAIADRNIERFGLLTDPEQAADMPGEATDRAGLAADYPREAPDTEAESNLTRLLEETHGSPR